MNKKYPIYMQNDDYSCGAYCIKMILKYYNIEEDISIIKKRLKLDENGSSFKGLIETLKYYKIESKAYYASFKDITIPSILHTINNDKGHFVVLYEINHNILTIGDPLKGIIQIHKKDLNYTNYVLIINGQKKHIKNKEIKLIHYLIKIQKQYLKYIILLIVLSLSLSILSFIINKIYSYIIDEIKISTQYKVILTIIIVYFICSLFKEILTYCKSIINIIFHKKLDKLYVYNSVKENIYDIKMNNNNELLHHKILDLFDLSEFTLQFYETLYIDGLFIIVFLIGLFFLSPYLIYILILLMFILTIIIFYKSKLLLKLYKLALNSQNYHNESLLEIISLKDIGVSYLGYDKWILKYYSYFNEYMNDKIKLKKEVVKIQFIIAIFTLSIHLVILVLGLYLYITYRLSMGNFMMFIMSMNLLIHPLLGLVNLKVDYKQNEVLFERYKDMIKDKDVGENIESRITNITINHLYYSYGYNEDILENINIVIDKTLFILGSNGCGKTTLLKLLYGNDKDYRGDIYFNNQSLKNISIYHLRKHVIYIGEDAFIKGSLLDNLMCNDLNKINDIFNDLKCDYYLNMLNKDISEFSKGQRQIISLVRGLLKDGDVYLLDEALSHIDRETLEIILNKMRKSHKIFIIVTHQNDLINKKDYCIRL